MRFQTEAEKTDQQLNVKIKLTNAEYSFEYLLRKNI